MWYQIRTQADADALLDRFGHFHDACLRELHLWTGHWVSLDLSMSCPGDLDVKIRALIQRQFTKPSAIEFYFEEVTRFNLVPTPQNYDSIIFSATLLVRDGQVFWSPEENWSPEMPNPTGDTYIAARRASWRDASDWLGSTLRYGPGPPGGTV
jgi:hypothetical protein